jgi:fibronectin-binding autotransporter adhesin
MRRGNAGQIGPYRELGSPGIVSLGELQQSKSGYTAPTLSAQCLVLAGGGGGGRQTGSGAGGGAGAGGVIEQIIDLVPNTLIQIIVGAGGSGQAGAGVQGSDSQIVGYLTAKGGGRSNTSGGSGGGGAPGQSGAASLDSSQGYAGGAGTSSTGGGGGGASSAGTSNSNEGGAGGRGIITKILGTPMTIAGGGAGYKPYETGFAYAPGGSGVGGNGERNAGSAVAGTGSGGASGWDSGGNGSAGFVVVRYVGSARYTGGTITTLAGSTIHYFTSSDYLTPI